MLHTLLAFENTIAVRVVDGVGDEVDVREGQDFVLPEEHDDAAQVESMHEPVEGHQAQLTKLLHEPHDDPPSLGQLLEYIPDVPELDLKLPVVSSHVLELKHLPEHDPV
jgi:hypothetical protein